MKDKKDDKPQSQRRLADASRRTRASEIQVVYSTEKKDWIEAVTAEFAKANPGIKVTLVGKGSLDAAQGILDEQLKPTVWSPADTMVMNMLASDWQTKNHAAIIADLG